MGENYKKSQSAIHEVSKCKICTLEELAIMQNLIENPTITQKMLATKLGKSERTIKSKILALQEKQLIRRVNGKRYGKWEVLIDISKD